MQTFTRLFLTTVAVAALTACGGGDDDAVSVSTPAPAQGQKAFTVSSPAFASGVIPRKHSKYGDNIKPAINISNLPGKTAKLAIVMDDETPPCGKGSKACLHANVFNIPASVTRLSEGWGELNGNRAIVYGQVFDGNSGYAGPQPPNGKHSYNLDVHALKASMPAVAAGDTPMTRSQFRAKYGKHILKTKTLTATFTTPATP